MSVRVVIADDSLLIREGLEQMLANEPEIELVASCADVDELLDAVGAATWTSSSPTSACRRR